MPGPRAASQHAARWLGPELSLTGSDKLNILNYRPCPRVTTESGAAQGALYPAPGQRARGEIFKLPTLEGWLAGGPGPGGQPGARRAAIIELATVTVIMLAEAPAQPRRSLPAENVTPLLAGSQRPARA